MNIIVDSREQLPFDFSRWPVTVQTGALETDDYSLPGFEDRIAVERKSLDDLIGCLMGDSRDRFERELARARRYELFHVVCEGSWADISRGGYKSQMKPESVLQSILAFTVRYQVPFVMAGNREAAEYLAHGLLNKFLYEIQKRFEMVTRFNDTVVKKSKGVHHDRQSSKFPRHSKCEENCS